VYSEQGRGATFKVYLPRCDDAATTHEREPAKERTVLGSETILLAEDEDAIRTLTGKVLRGLGYRVLEADKGAAALEIA
jgi:hypothetical protein